MNYDFTAIPDADVPLAVEPIFQHILQTYASEANKTVSVWRAVPDHLLDFKPHEKANPIRSRPGCAWPGMSRSRRSTGLPAT